MIKASEITIKEVRTPAELKVWVQFPTTLYHGNPYYVPALVKDELNYWNRDKNAAFNDGTGVQFLACHDQKIVGRIAATINHKDFSLKNEGRCRWGWIDFINDIEVTRALFKAVENWAADQIPSVHFLEGPMGLTNLDKAGLLVEGFKELDNITTWYHAPYYREHIESCGYDPHARYKEYVIQVPDTIPDRVVLFSKRISERMQLRAVTDKSPQKIIKYTRDVFKLMNSTHGGLHGFIPFEEKMIDYYTSRYAQFIEPDFTSIVVDKDDRLVAFGLALPNLSRAFQKSRGKLFPLGWFHIRKAIKKNKRADLLLIGVRPDLQSKGVPAIIFLEIMQGFMKHGIEEVESNPELENNLEVQRLWSKYDARQHKKRMTYIKHI